MRSTRARACLTVAAGLIAVAAVPGDSAAGVASVEERKLPRSYDGARLPVKMLFYSAGDGERNNLRISFDGTVAVVRDSSGVTAGQGCASTDTREVVRCDFDVYIDPEVFFSRPYMRVRLGDGDDRALIAGARTDGPGDDDGPGAAIDGGPGDDFLRGGWGNNELRGGSGDDVLIGRGSVDKFLEGSTASGADSLIVRSGQPRITYSGRLRPVSITLDGLANDGEADEGDRIRVSSLARRAGVWLEGGNGDDNIEGSGGNDILVGGPGADTLSGEGRNDWLIAGRPRLRTDRNVSHDLSADREYGGGGADTLWGSDGPNVLVGGAGGDQIVAAGGDDIIRARDGEADALVCGDGADRAILDSLDFWRPARGNCERSIRPVPPTAAFAGVDEEERRYLGTQRRAYAYVACPGDAPPRCVGLARIVRGHTVLGSASIDIARGRIEQVSIRITETGRRLVRARERLRVALEVVSKDRAGVWRTTRVNDLFLEFNDPTDVDFGPQDP